MQAEQAKRKQFKQPRQKRKFMAKSSGNVFPISISHENLSSHFNISWGVPSQPHQLKDIWKDNQPCVVQIIKCKCLSWEIKWMAYDVPIEFYITYKRKNKSINQS